MAWTYNAERDQCYLHQFTPEQPDLNYRNEKVVDEMMNVFKVWLDRGADGFRIDAINHMFEADGLPNEEYVDANGDKTVYDNLVHDQTMNQVSSDNRKDEYLSNFPFNSLNHTSSSTNSER